MDNYNVIHLHTDYSNGVTNIDSVTKYNEYIDRAVELNMKAIAFTEHGSLFEWHKKKEYCEKSGLKYIHAVEAYVTETLDETIRDNYHCCLYSKNFDGFLELNKLISKSFNREDGSYYYNPRITVEDLLNTSDNIIMSSACLGGFFGNKSSQELKLKILKFMSENKHRCFLEIQQHLAEDQIKLNKMLYEISKTSGIRLIAGTDTHCLNDEHVKGRSILQKSKNIHFDNEDGWDLTFKTYDELVEMYKKQNAIPMEIVLDAINNTNVLADMIEEFKVDTSYKYPKLWNDSLNLLKNKIKAGILLKGLNNLPNYETEYVPRIQYELETYIHNGAIDFLLLDEDIKSEMRKRNIEAGYSRGSVSGSLIAYIIGMTDVDSIKHNLSFERFMNKERVSLADVDTDWQPNHRDIVKDYIYNKEGLYCADIITFNTVALKGSIRDVARALEIDLKLVGEICNGVDDERTLVEYRKKYKELFDYVDIINGTIVSVGTHPCGLICSPITLDDNMGLCTVAKCKNPVSMISMKSIDAQNFVKLDILGLANIQLINETCKLAKIDRLTPSNVIEDDIEVWNSMRDDNLLIFQWESGSAGDFLKTLLSNNTINKIKEKNPNFRYMDLLSMGNGAIRPAGASYREALSKGEFRDNGHEALNSLLAATNGYLVYQEQILRFLNEFCGYTMGKADVIRRGFAKKTGTEQFIPEIKSGFIKTMKEKYNVSEEESERIVVDFIQVIEDASSYLFSLNHSEPYSYIGYICAYLRYYYPLEFLTVALNINSDDLEKTREIAEYANKRGISIRSPKFGYSKGEYFFDKETNTIYKGIGCIKNLNLNVGDELYELSKNNFKDFVDILVALQDTSINSRQLDILVKIGFFNSFGKTQNLIRQIELFNSINPKKQFSKSKLPLGLSEDLFRKYSQTETKSVFKDVAKIELIKEVASMIPNKELPIQTLLESEINNIGYVNYKNSRLDKRYVLITDVNSKYTPVINTYSLGSGVSVKCKISKKIWEDLQVGNIIYINSMEKKFGFKKVGEDENGKPKFEKDESKQEWWITNYSIINGNIDFVLEELNA